MFSIYLNFFKKKEKGKEFFTQFLVYYHLLLSFETRERFNLFVKEFGHVLFHFTTGTSKLKNQMIILKNIFMYASVRPCNTRHIELRQWKVNQIKLVVLRYGSSSPRFSFFHWGRVLFRSVRVNFIAIFPIGLRDVDGLSFRDINKFIYGSGFWLLFYAKKVERTRI